MNPTRSKKFRLDISCRFARSLVGGDDLDQLQDLLLQHAPGWSAGLHVWRYRQEKTQVDVHRPGAFAAAVLAAATERGPLYHHLERQFGSEADEWIFGGAELRGADSSVILIVQIDERVFCQNGESWRWCNYITFQVGRAKVDGVDSVAWSRAMFTALCSALSPVYAQAYMSDEFHAKNISHEGGGTAAVGVDVSKAFPGLYWLNFFGAPYRDFLGRERLLSSPAHEVRELDDGVLVALDSDPRAWDTPAYRAAERRVLDHLGQEHFFSKSNPYKRTVAPDFGLPPAGPRRPIRVFPDLLRRWRKPNE
jgi:hypothetical protein